MGCSVNSFLVHPKEATQATLLSMHIYNAAVVQQLYNIKKKLMQQASLTKTQANALQFYANVAA